MLISSVLFSANPDPEGPFMGIGYATSEKPAGLKVTNVVRNSPAFIAGIETGDVIISMDGRAISNAESLSVFMKTKSPGNRVKIILKRGERELKKYLILGRRGDYEGTMRSGGREKFPVSADSIMQNWKGNIVDSLVFTAISRAKYDEHYKKLSNAFAKELDSYRGYYTLDAVSLSLLEPIAVFASGEDVKRKLAIHSGDPANIMRGASLVLDESSYKEPMKPNPSSLGGIISAVRYANSVIDSAFRELSEDDLETISDYAPFLLDIFARSVYISADSDDDLVEGYEELIEATKKIDYPALLAVGQLLAGLDDAISLNNLTSLDRRKYKDIDRDIILDTMVCVGERDSSGKKISIMARMIVTGYRGMTYSEQAAIWIDLGGDDTYFGFCGGTPYTVHENVKHRFASGRVGLHIELGGNDTYIRKTVGSIGSGFVGAGALIDLSGNDRYIGGRLTQGSCFCGTGLLIDRAGNDEFTAEECAQGFAVFGSALLYDSSGDDLYTATRYAQGVGVTKGLGILVDCYGNDKYLASFKIPNNYGNEDTWEGWSQGVGLGFRSLASGGIGILCDRAGNDRYEAGNFSQACGYFFGMGILDDVSGDDVYFGNRYTQGAAAHQACSSFRDREGNDIYRGREATNQSGSWDITSTIFIDDKGNDSYVGGSLSQAGSAQNGFAIFIDFFGKDVYESGGTSNGSGGGNDYHPNYDARSLSIFLDLGSLNDDYKKTNGKRKNNSFIKTDDDKNKKTGDGIFWDK